MDDLKGKLIAEAISLGICKIGELKMEESDIDGLIDYYIENPDWCMEREYPSLAILKQYFREIENKGVFIDKEFQGEMLNDQQVYIFHNCKGYIRVGLNLEKKIIPMLYFGNNCNLEIVGVGNDMPWPNTRPVIPIYMFGTNEILARDSFYVKFSRFLVS